MELPRTTKIGYLSPVTLSVNLQRIMRNLLDDIQIRWVIVPETINLFSMYAERELSKFDISWIFSLLNL
jgi:hypothetical protein